MLLMTELTELKNCRVDMAEVSLEVAKHKDF